MLQDHQSTFCRDVGGGDDGLSAQARTDQIATFHH